MSEPAPGDPIDQYLLEDLVARSGMASIFKARDTLDPGAAVALKIPHLQFESDVVFFERFQREEEIGQRLDHPNIIKVYKPRHKSRVYVAMEYVEGKSIRQLLDEQRPLPQARALAIAQQICEALVYLHGQGVVHRDLKPENILVTPEGVIKILDFGIALDKAARRLTWFGLSSTLGTPDYIAPEQIGGRRGDVRTDVYAVGTMLYEMLTGNLPFSGPNAFAMMRAKTHDEPKAPSYFVPGFDASLEAILLKAIERDPRGRYPGAAEMLQDLRNPSAVPARDAGAGGSSRRGGGGFGRRAVVPLVIAAVLAGLASLVWLTGRHPAAPGAAQSVPRGK
ncbi:MAG: hypothetical protein NVSMB23_02710 [Myxococcales bacterium]